MYTSVVFRIEQSAFNTNLFEELGRRETFWWSLMLFRDMFSILSTLFIKIVHFVENVLQYNR